ncbi:hypothetical protein [Dethiosulfovibrio salsuginis]|uniref:Uncharacterized protein n=1 Tax=Dethiosulfovibrio salsuginis TaxID=561720 RepID=A0A1X7LEV7_9BACT|nr:hypothetical protein [Dethiosulfovibrio salsuginis]SMG51709.1 hypothetical protein SAMN06275492_1577 [Dethiosulfovibrio salsuginis]
MKIGPAFGMPGENKMVTVVLSSGEVLRCSLDEIFFEEELSFYVKLETGEFRELPEKDIVQIDGREITIGGEL